MGQPGQPRTPMTGEVLNRRAEDTVVYGDASVIKNSEIRLAKFFASRLRLSIRAFAIPIELLSVCFARRPTISFKLV